MSFGLPESVEKAEFIKHLPTVSDEEVIAKATDDMLARCLCTCDGAGPKIKYLTLQEYLRRIESKAFQDGVNQCLSDLKDQGE